MIFRPINLSSSFFVAVSFFLIYPVAAEFEWRVCDGFKQRYANIHSIEISPDPIMPDQNLTVTIKGTLNIQYDSGDLHAVFRTNLAFLPPLTLDYELCSMTECPVEPGIFERNITLLISKVANIVSVATGTVEVSDLKGRVFSCVDVSGSIGLRYTDNDDDENGEDENDGEDANGEADDNSDGDYGGGSDDEFIADHHYHHNRTALWPLLSEETDDIEDFNYDNSITSLWNIVMR